MVLFKLRLPAKKGEIVGGKMALTHRNYSEWLCLVYEKLVVCKVIQWLIIILLLSCDLEGEKDRVHAYIVLFIYMDQIIYR